MRNYVVLAMAGLIGVIHATLVDDYYSYCGCLVLRIMNDTEHASLAQKYMDTITITPNDHTRCFAWTNFSNYTIDSFPDANGQPTNFSQAVGIFAPDAYKICAPPSMKQVLFPHHIGVPTVADHNPPTEVRSREFCRFNSGTSLAVHSALCTIGHANWEYSRRHLEHPPIPR
jgi:hypothetical protein